MPNPFGGTISGKNTSHTNQNNLVYALIPRSTSNVREIVGDTAATLSGASMGSYDADGYLFGSSATSASYASVTVGGLGNSAAQTVIMGMKWVGAGNSGIVGGYLSRSAEPYVLSGIYPDEYANRTRMRITDGTRDFNNGYLALSSAYSAAAVTSTAGAQKARYLNDSALNGNGGIAGTIQSHGSDGTFTMTGGNMDSLTIQVASAWGIQYLLIYNAVLSDGDIQAIMANPGAVVNQTGTNLPHQLRRGAPRGIARGMQ